MIHRLLLYVHSVDLLNTLDANAGAYLVTKVCGPILCDSGSSSVSGSSQNGDGDGVTVVVCC